MMLAGPKRRGPYLRIAMLGDYRPPSQSSKTVLSTVYVGGPRRTDLRTFRWAISLSG